MPRPEYLHTRNGLMVRVMARSDTRIIGHIHGEPSNRVWGRDGRFLLLNAVPRDHPMDLVDVPPHEGPACSTDALFIGVTRDAKTGVIRYVPHNSEYWLRSLKNIIAIVPVTITWTEGDGL